MLQNQFENYISSLGISPKSFKNYKSDFSHFFGWAILKLKSFGTYIEELSELVPFLNSNFVREYQSFMLDNSSPVKTINRRLSTLRHLSNFLIKSQLADEDFMSEIQNVGTSAKKRTFSTSLIEGFSAHLEAEKVSRNTIKNYQSDIRQFLAWLENNHARFA